MKDISCLLSVEVISELAANDPYEKSKEAARAALVQLRRKRTLFKQEILGFY